MSPIISKPMTMSSSVLSAAGPNKYNRIPSTISPTITQAIKRVVCVTVIMAYSPAQIRFGLTNAANVQSSRASQAAKPESKIRIAPRDGKRRGAGSRKPMAPALGLAEPGPQVRS
jgi:hypothetical protein